MITLERVELLGWDIQADQIVLLQPGVNLLTGENGSGKTSLLDGIKMALGARSIGGDRDVDHYLTGRGSPVAMVRVVASNRRDPGSGRRPFDVLAAGHVEDRVSLAVVFRATDDGYEKSWYIVDGDSSPLSPGAIAPPMRLRDYHDRLEKLGLGRSYRTMMCTPQGEIAALCRHAPKALFDLLYDLIGGKQVFDEWRKLRDDYQVLVRDEAEHSAKVLQVRQRLEMFQSRLQHHERFRGKLEEAEVLALALPGAVRRELAEQCGDLEARLEQARRDGRDAERERDALQELRAQGEQEAQAHQARTGETSAEEARVDSAREALTERRAQARARWETLDQARKAAAGVTPSDLEALRAADRAAQAVRAGLDRDRAELETRLQALEAERDEVRSGLLRPPEAVATFREVLQQHKVPHHLLMDLLEPTGEARPELESWLGDMRFAVAVPDVDAFAQAVRLARVHRFPYYVLAPDVRSRQVEAGAHFLCDAVDVRDPRYKGLVTRLLRRVEKLGADEAVEDTWRGRGARVDPAGYVVDRLGGVDRGTDRFFLGRDALKRREEELSRALEAVEGERVAVAERLGGVASELSRLAVAMAAEQRRLDWLEVSAEHAALSERLRGLAREIEATEVERTGIRQRARALDDERRELAERRGQQAERHQALEGRIARSEAEADRTQAKLALERDRWSAAEVDAVTAEAQAGRALEAVRERAGKPAAMLRELLRRTNDDLSSFPVEARDENLPTHVRTLETQLEAVRLELERIAGDVRHAGDTAERAHRDYELTTKRVFRGYFARLGERGRELGFHLDGRLQPAPDQTFEAHVQVGVGDKAPVSYSSPALSGGQKAAISILMAMSTLETTGDGVSGAGFFIIDEPFSASDIRKIQELGHFLERTGGQYLVSMPMTMDLKQCGAWLSAVLTCTQVAGGSDERGELRLAPPVRFSYVVRDG